MTTHRESRKLKAVVKAACGEDWRFVKKKTNAELEEGGEDPLFLSVCFFFDAHH